MRAPVRPVVLVLAIASMAVFVGVLGWGAADRNRAAAAGRRTEVQQGGQTASTPPPSRTPAQPQSSRPQSPPAGATHTVAEGDTLSRIARLYGVPVSQIRTANGLKSDQIRAGQALLIPGAQPVRTHKVEQGDTLWEISSRYGVDMAELLSLNRKVGDPGHLQIGEELVLPPRSGSIATVATSSEAELSLGGLFSWPNSAEISSQFGPRWGRNHAGIDFAANHGDAIKAARSGQVEHAGEIRGYGNTVILMHPDGTRTLYAHASRLLVTSGQTVQQGETIALVGSTGNSTGPHLHFEIIVNGKPRNPLLYLPRK